MISEDVGIVFKYDFVFFLNITEIKEEETAQLEEGSSGFRSLLLPRSNMSGIPVYLRQVKNCFLITSKPESVGKLIICTHR